MRTSLQMASILCACLLSTWLISRSIHASPTVVSGIVIDWRTGRPAAFAPVLVDGLNTPMDESQTDANGRFHLKAPDEPQVLFLYAGEPRYGRLLQTTFGTTIFVYRKGEKVPDVVIPAFPSTEVSGHVYGNDGKPVAGCFVSAVTRGVRSQVGQDLQVMGWGEILPYDLAKAADPMHLEDVDSAKTDAEGRYTLKRLGADRYYLLTRCDFDAWNVKAQRRIFEPVFYPDVPTVSQAKEVVLLPGDHRDGVDFHLRQRTAYGFKGRLLSSDGSAWRRNALYLQDLVVVRSDEALGSTWLSREACQTYANEGEFHCSALLPGTYTFYFCVESSVIQTAKFELTVSGPMPAGAEVQLKQAPNGGVKTFAVYAGPGGTLDTEGACGQLLVEQPNINLLVWGPGHTALPCTWMFRSSPVERTLLLPPGDYAMSAVEGAFKLASSHLGSSLKLQSILIKHGTHVHIERGRTARPSLPLLRTNELIDIALRYLS